MQKLRTQQAVARQVGESSWSGLEALEGRLLLDTYFVAVVAGGGTGSSALPFNSIQDAIDAAADGDTVSVRPGTYTEDLVIDVANLTLTSTNGASRTTIRGVHKVAVASYPLADPNIEIIANGVELSGFTIQSPAFMTDFYSSGIVIDATDVDIHDNRFRVASADSDHPDELPSAIQTYRDDIGPNGTDLSGLNIHNNTFTSYGPGAAGFEAIYVNHTLGDPDPDGAIGIANNTISGRVVRGILSERSWTNITGNTVTTTLAPGDTYQGISARDYDGRPQADVLIQNNTVGGSTAGQGFLIGIRAGAVGGQTLTTFNISNNFVDRNDTGVQVNDSADEVDIIGNSLTRNTTWSVQNNDDDETLNASGNWWGSTVAAVVAGETDGDVDYTPWLGSRTDTSRATGFQGSYSTLYVDDDSPQTGVDGRIHEAIDDVTGSTVNVLAGTYTEDLEIDKDNLKLIGAGRNTTTITGTSTGDGDFEGGNFLVDAANVTITGFTLQTFIDVGNVGSAVYLKGRLPGTAMNLKMYNNEINVQTDDGGGEDDYDGEYDVRGIDTDEGNLSGVQIYNNRFTGTPNDGYNGIHIDGADDGSNVSIGNQLKIQDNTFVGNVQLAIWVETSNTRITGNNIATSLWVGDAWSGILVQNWQEADDTDISNVRIEKNIISGFDWAIDLGHNVGTDELLQNISVLSNTINGGTGGVLVQSSAEGVTIRGNRFSALTGYAVENADIDRATQTLNAARNWWGDSSGPYHPTTNPDGMGEAVGDFVLFTPYSRS